MVDENGFMSAKEAAEYLRIHVRTLYNYVSAGKIPFRKPNGGPKRYLKKDLDDFMGFRKWSGWMKKDK
ncbi:MAG: helix-turn-helix domain-containing protein [Desulfococcaceae bacterium]